MIDLSTYLQKSLEGTAEFSAPPPPPPAPPAPHIIRLKKDPTRNFWFHGAVR